MKSSKPSKTNRVPTTPQAQMFVRYLGSRACWTLPDGRFYMGYREELTIVEQALCENGGGYLPVSSAIATVAK